jgi:hypothetical protein
MSCRHSGDVLGSHGLGHRVGAFAVEELGNGDLDNLARPERTP